MKVFDRRVCIKVFDRCVCMKLLKNRKQRNFKLRIDEKKNVMTENIRVGLESYVV
jgi:hypothetical protein